MSMKSYVQLLIGISFFACPGFSIDEFTGSVKTAEYHNRSLSPSYFAVDPHKIKLSCSSGVLMVLLLFSTTLHNLSSFSMQ